jgi:hypothetical protein
MSSRPSTLRLIEKVWSNTRLRTCPFSAHSEQGTGSLSIALGASCGCQPAIRALVPACGTAWTLPLSTAQQEVQCCAEGSRSDKRRVLHYN